MSETLQAQTAQAPPAVTGCVPYLGPSDAAAAIAFYKQAFGAEEVSRMPAQDGKRLMHAHLLVNGSALLMSDRFPEFGAPVETPAGFHIHLQVDDGAAWWRRAVDAGAEVVMAYDKQFWGDHYGELKDPFGYKWSIGSSSPAA